MSSYPLLSTKNGRTWDISANAITTTGAITCNGGALTGTFYSNNVSAIRVPNGPSTTRPSGLQGYIRYNHDTSTNFLEYFDSPANAWIPLAPSPLISSVTPNFVTDASGSAGYYDTNPLLIAGSNFLQGSTVSYRDPSGVITNAPTTYFYSGVQLGATVPSAVYNPIPYKSPFSIIVTNPGNYIGILNNALSATSSRSFTVSGLTGGSSTTRYLSTTSGPTDTSSNTTPFPSGSTLYTFTTTDASLSTSLFSVTPNFTGTVTYLVVAGGGAGSDDGITSNGNGGGGAGGYLTGSISVSNGVAYSLQVGGGGAGITLGIIPPNGSNSIFSSITAAGGGSGGYYVNQPGANGGSGGGGGAYNTFGGGAGGIATPAGQGNNGGSGGSGAGGGGGGGAGTPGSSSTGSGAAGGTGLPNTISGLSVVYAGGGGGSPGGLGGLGGGGNAASSPGNGFSGTPGTGGGGGASIGNGSTGGNFSGTGGSGIVILRFNSFS